MSTLTDLFSTIESATETAAADGAAARERSKERIAFFAAHTADLSTDWELPEGIAPATKNLYAFQRNGVRLALEARLVLLGWQPGCGKTLPAMAVAAHTAANGGRTLMVVPPSLRTQTKREFEIDYGDRLSIAVVEGQKEADLPEADVVVIGDAVLAHRQDDILRWAPDTLIFDEAQRFKNPRASRTKAIKAIAAAMDEDAIKLGLTGTLVVNRVSEVYSPLAILGPRIETAVSGRPGWNAFDSRHCYTVDQYGGRTAKDADELHGILARTCYNVVDPAKVMDMPEKVTATKGLDLNGELATYRRIERDFINWLMETKGRQAALSAIRAEAITKMNALRQEAGKAKVKATAAYATDIVAQGEGVVIMADHRSVVEGLEHEFRNTKFEDADGVTRFVRVSTFSGANTSTRDEELADFKAGRTDVLVVNIAAGGQGLNIQESKHLIFCQLPWSPGQFNQCSRRVVRANSVEVHGADAVITIHVLNGVDTIDERMWSLLDAKAAEADVINTGEGDVTLDGASMFNEMLGSYGW